MYFVCLDLVSWVLDVWISDVVDWCLLCFVSCFVEYMSLYSELVIYVWDVCLWYFCMMYFEFPYFVIYLCCGLPVVYDCLPACLPERNGNTRDLLHCVWFWPCLHSMP